MANPDDIIRNTAGQHIAALKAGEYSARDLAEAYLDRAEGLEDMGIFLRLGRERILARAEASDRRRAKGQALSPLDGVPVTVKDNICEKGEYATCASRMLENFFAPYDATVIEKLNMGGAVLFGRTNMDEFAMGSSGENSAFGLTRNPWNAEYVPGGSSSGSAAAIAAAAAPLALGSDTGGSIRQPAAFTGCVGLKPTYGRVSRYGLVAFASSLDQIGPFARTVEDAALLLSLLNGHDPRDATSHKDADRRPIDPTPKLLEGKDWQGVRVGVDLPGPGATGFDADVIAAGQRARDWLADQGAEIVPIESRFRESVIPIYYILAPAEASSNLSRYDGVRYGHRAAEYRDLIDLYIKSRTEGFGPEVKRRILLGTFVLSSGYYDAYYNSAQKARRQIQREFGEFFQKVDVILSPTSPTTAFKIGEKNDPLSMYQSDLLTIAANLGGVPAISIPAGVDGSGLPIGLQLTANHFDENNMLSIAASLARAPGFALGLPELAGKSKTKSSARPPAVEEPAGKAPAAKNSSATKHAPKPVKKTAVKKPSKKKPAAKKTTAKKKKSSAKKVVKKPARKTTAGKKAKAAAKKASSKKKTVRKKTAVAKKSKRTAKKQARKKAVKRVGAGKKKISKAKKK